jgi:hypothetical protein
VQERLLSVGLEPTTLRLTVASKTKIELILLESLRTKLYTRNAKNVLRCARLFLPIRLIATNNDRRGSTKTDTAAAFGFSSARNFGICVTAARA